ncbi:CCA tRNA nucleotidyltransferase [Oceanicella actignis]|uniref:Poly(A) polymerase n=1 Tax=Oceanicella actignis TaxID=1189325 RepID=A0A1M7SSP8_9RHOB|nr:CCA tRNA nucleotidyltransferase [Oceanicella actignis]SES69019.1 poly(A) polymerase [Oceanicella actignis]SHN61451.1 poly(A) polymerase [Oceanicella actignis]
MSAAAPVPDLAPLDDAWLRDPAAQRVAAALLEGGAQALFVGGCVRNALLSRFGAPAPVADVDLATDARPERTVELLTRAGLRAVPTGIAHGTVTAVADGRPFEITTFRADLRGHGRHAEVAFGADLAQDAARRDFTMNALYARPDGAVLDPVGGLPDLRARRVRFIGDAGRRIREDYLRILRFFRFHAWYGANGIDPEGLAACAEGLDGLDRLSRERIGHEMRRLLAAPDPAPALAAMAACGALARVLPGADPALIAPLTHVEALAGAAPDWLRRLAALAPGADADELARALRLSNAERRRLAAAAAAREAAEPPARAAWRHGPDAARDAALIDAAARAAPPPADLEAELARGAGARMPVRARDLAARGVAPGPQMGAELRRLEEAWLDSDMRLDAEALLARVGKG